jgi:hypothetical protein
MTFGAVGQHPTRGYPAIAPRSVFDKARTQELDPRISGQSRKV